MGKSIIFVGAGVLNATLATLLNKIEPGWNLKIFERLSHPAEESSNERNNAGTGHAALCELNYTVEQPDGSIDVERAKVINEQFEISKQFWSYLVKEKIIENPKDFINALPHISFVHGEKNSDFLERRYKAMKKHPMFETMSYTRDYETLKKWLPLVMEGRDKEETISASKIDEGTDVNFGELTRQMMKHLEKTQDVYYNQEVLDFKRLSNGKWQAKIKNVETGSIDYHIADYVIIGAGGNAIPMLQKTKIEESKNLGGFPISGAFLMCNKAEIVAQHNAKAYGKEPEGTPPMTVPHIDRRYIDGVPTLLFGPFAEIGPKFLKQGSNLDLFKSINMNNIGTLLSAGVKNIPLIKYSIEQITMDKSERMKALRTFLPNAKDEDWDLIIAGKRVQIIKDSELYGKGYIQFGTEVVYSKDHSVVGLLGESPGASTCVSVALEVLENNFEEKIGSWAEKISEMVPSYGFSLIKDSNLLRQVKEASNKTLQLK